jgi:RNase H-fold protein (predicted Holliday junction resolvase)
MSLEARAFGTRVGAAMRKDVVFFDETLTSWDAEETLKARGKNLRDARLRGDIDRAAAVSILRSYLQALEAEARPPLADFDPDEDGRG